MNKSILNTLIAISMVSTQLASAPSFALAVENEKKGPEQTEIPYALPITTHSKEVEQIDKTTVPDLVGPIGLMKEISFSSLPKEIVLKMNDGSKRNSSIVYASAENKSYVATRALDLWTSSNSAYYYKMALIAAAKTVSNWENAFTNIDPKNNLSKSSIDTLKSMDEKLKYSKGSDEEKLALLEEISKIKNTDIDSAIALHTTSAEELAQAVGKSNDLIAKVLKNKTLGDNVDSILYKSIPTSVFYFGAVRVPEKLKSVLLKIPKIGTYLKNLTNGSVTITSSVIPWYVTITEPNKEQKGSTTKSTRVYFEQMVHIWANVDSNKKVLGDSTIWRTGAGVLFGEINKLDDISGLYSGGSFDMKVSKELFPSVGDRNLNIKLGGIFTSESIKNPSLLPIQNAYFMVGFQKGVIGEQNSANARVNLGGVIPLKELSTDLIPGAQFIGEVREAIKKYIGTEQATEKEAEEKN